MGGWVGECPPPTLAFIYVTLVCLLSFSSSSSLFKPAFSTILSVLFSSSPSSSCAFSNLLAHRRKC